MSDLIRLLVASLPPVLLLVAILVAAVPRHGEPPAERFLGWVLLLAVGVTSVLTGLFHVFAPELIASASARRVGSFQYEVGIGDIAIGLVAIDAFQRSLPYRSAVAGYVVLLYAGIAAGYVPQVLQAPDVLATGQVPGLSLMVAKAVVLLGLLGWAWAGRKANPVRRDGSGGRI